MSIRTPEPNEKECLEVLKGLINIKSYSQTEGERDVTTHIADVMKSVNLDARIHPFANGSRQNAVGVWRGSGGGKSLLFNGHLDTNPVTEGWTVDPWEGLVRDGMIYGIGVSNMKSGCAAYYCAVKTLMDAGWRPRGDVILTYVVGELQGGPGTVALIEEGVCKADYFVNCEPSDLKAITTHASSQVFRIELTGVTRHMSKREEATDVNMALSSLIPRLDELIFPNAKNEDAAACNRCSIGVVRSGLGRELAEWRPPQIADFAVLKGSARFGPGQGPNDVSTALEVACEETKLHLPGLSYKVPKDAFIVKRLNSAYSKVRPGSEQPTGALKPQCFYGSDAGHLYGILGMQGVVCGPGGKYNTMPDERVEILDYMACIRMFIHLITDVCG